MEQQFKYTNYHVIKDPIHGVIQFSDLEDRWTKPFINHKHLQRLRNIKQNGLADFTFPGAVYTRFNHVLGCAYVGSQIANNIGLCNEDKQLVILACLLHDIGHGPFSHAFEGLFTYRCINHEEWTPYFLQEFAQEGFLQEYNQLNPDYPLDKTKIEKIQQMIMHEYTENKLLSDIVSSQIDADRFDYLLRDSHFCGVKYGEFDLLWMLHCLTPVKTAEGFRLGITHKGVGVVEHYLLARWLMIRNIYHHPKKIAVENLLIKFMTKLAEQIPTADFLACYRETNIGKLLVAANLFNQKHKDQKPNSQAVSQFIAENFDLYKSLCDFHVISIAEELSKLDLNDDIVKLASCLRLRQIPVILPLRLTQIDDVQVLIDKFKSQFQDQINDWQVEIISTPQLCYSENNDPILVKDKEGHVSRINDISHVVSALSDRYEHACALFIDKELSKTQIAQDFLKQVKEAVSL